MWTGHMTFNIGPSEWSTEELDSLTDKEFLSSWVSAAFSRMTCGIEYVVGEWVSACDIMEIEYRDR